MSRAGLLALAVVAAALVLPASSPAATVGVEEVVAERETTDPQQARLSFVGGAGEANRLTVSVAGEDGDFYDLRLVDSAVPIQPGPRCSGGGAAGVPVLCRVRKPTLGDNYSCFKGCYASPGTAWELTLSFALGGAGSHLDTTALPASAANKSKFTSPAAVEVTVVPGAGDDTVLTGAGPDQIGASPGADLIRTGEGSDTFHAGPVADGPDDVDLGGGYEDAIDFSERGEGVRYDPDGEADDGAAGEGDDLGAAARVQGGAGADTLISDSGDALEYGATIAGGAGDDAIFGSRRNDGLSGGPGDDELVGGDGHDQLMDPAYYGGEGSSGNDSAEGGPGNDEIALGEGDDEADGGPDRDRVALGPGSDSGKGGSGDDILLGEAGRDELEAGPGKDRLSGDGGRDRLFGGAGGDRIAAGMVVSLAWGYGGFVDSPGPLEGRPDEVGCEAGRDVVRAGTGDAASGCEAVLRAAPLEVRGFADGDSYFPPRIKFSIRRPGTARLEGSGLKLITHTFRRNYGAFNFALRPVGRARQTLLREGHVELRLRISFRAAGGRQVARVYSIDLWKSGELERREPV